ncbi:MAG: rod shape-determining protein [Patescibacteria group bacterium]|nr:rod shape-determining protein [Patescibacteria group bacterium]MDD5121442.1 rod shape-determining protein [Patescibacteria group bacterium]MDD5222198.1 rod shape-determining protein [Patescibacteria group bacterium]MDD5396396.1 rod shape-determining protein [Patescibacteria group bacterium]
MFNNLLGLFAKDIGVDLGTANTRIYIKDRGLVLNEPSVVAINTRTDQIIALGQMALRMIGKVPPHIQIVKPIVNGVVSDFEVAEKMLRLIFEKIHHGNFFITPRPRVVATIPLDVTEVEKKSLEDVILQAGARQVFLVERPMAAAIGSRLPIHESIGNLMVELGGGLSEVAVISLSGVVTWKSLKIGGETLNKQLIQYLREKFGILLGDQTAEEIKTRIGAAAPNDKPQEIKVRGRDLISGLPKEINITDAQVREAILPILKQIVESISDTIEKTPPELVADIYERGVVVSGGGSLLRNIDKLIQKKINIPIHLADDPLTTSVRGAGLILEDFENLKSVLIPSARA